MDAPPLTTALQVVDGAPRLLGGRSASSGLLHFPLAAVCPYTGADDVEPEPLPTEGTLWAWTAVTAAPPGYTGPVPYGMGVVELDGGLRVVTRLTVADPGALTFGEPMTLVTEEVPGEDGPALVWAFAPRGRG